MESTVILKAVAPIILAMMMLGLGLSLTTSDFKKLASHPKAVIAGSLLQIIGLPIIGFVLINAFSLSAELAVGFMVLVACPGGPGSNMVSYLCRGDAALSVTLTAISSVLAIFSIPLVTELSYNQFMASELQSFSVLKTSIAVFLITFVPIIVGMIIRSKSAWLAKKTESPVKIGSIIFLLLLVVSTFYKERANLPLLVGETGLPIVTLAITTVATGFLMGRVFGFSLAVQKTFAIELGIQNGALAIVIASSFLSSSVMAIPTALYSPVMISVALLFLIHAGITKPRPEKEDTTMRDYKLAE